MVAEPKPTAKSDADIVRKKDIVDHLTAMTSLDGKQSRLAVNAMLTFLRQSLDAGKRIDMTPLGRINRRVQKAGTPEEKVVYRLIPAKDKPAGKAKGKRGKSTSADEE
ncbi:MAG: HU family DNA-binding protein [Rhodobacteraceae bacterium]|nr:HU family DNA-binding protein [Paracoccaceae bacterium]